MFCYVIHVDIEDTEAEANTDKEIDDTSSDVEVSSENLFHPMGQVSVLAEVLEATTNKINSKNVKDSLNNLESNKPNVKDNVESSKRFVLISTVPSTIPVKITKKRYYHKIAILGWGLI